MRCPWKNSPFNMLDISSLEPVKSKKKGVYIQRVLYQHSRLKEDADEAAVAFNAQTEKIIIVKEDSNPLSWKVILPDHLQGQNVVLVHSTENNVDFAELCA